MKTPTSTTRSMRGLLFAALLLSLTACLLLAGCSTQQQEDGTIPLPQGMKDATDNGQGYYLFLPDDWTVDHSTGVTSATYATARITFAAFTSDREPAEYWEASRAETEGMFTDFSMEEEAAATLLGKNAALRYKFSGILHDGNGDGEKDKYGVTQYISRKDGRLYVLTYLAPYENDYEQYTAVVEAVVTNFLFTDTQNNSTPTPELPKTEGAPEGMKEITDPAIHDFRLFIPVSWVTDLQNGTVSAYVSDDDRTSISLVRNYPTNANSLPEYFANLDKDYKDKLTDYTLLTTEITEEDKRKATTDELDSLRYEFTATYNGVSYHFFQELFVRGSYVYTFTYTATSELYESHLAEADAMLAAIHFE